MTRVQPALLLFLDFDGVLHGWNTKIFSRLEAFENFLRDHKHIRVVFSTSWRESHTFEKLTEYFAEDVRAQFLGSTKILQVKWPPYIKHERHVECVEFMTSLGYTGNWIAIDDADDLFEPECENLFLVNGSFGLDEKAVECLRARVISIV